MIYKECDMILQYEVLRFANEVTYIYIHTQAHTPTALSPE